MQFKTPLAVLLRSVFVCVGGGGGVMAPMSAGSSRFLNPYRPLVHHQVFTAVPLDVQLANISMN